MCPKTRSLYTVKGSHEMAFSGENCTALKGQFKVENFGEQVPKRLHCHYQWGQRRNCYRPKSSNPISYLLAERKISLKRCFKSLIFGDFAEALTGGIGRSRRFKRCRKRAILPRIATETSDAYYAERRRDGTTDILQGMVNTRNSRRPQSLQSRSRYLSSPAMNPR